MKDFIKKNLPIIADIRRRIAINNRVADEKRFFIKNWANSTQDSIKVGYRILMNVHALEKGMSNKSPRYFGVGKVKEIINCLDLYDQNGWKKDFSYELGVSILNAYMKFYESMGWTDREEYKIVKKRNADKTVDLKTGVCEIRKKNFIKDASIDFGKFLSSRHSFRDFSKDPVLTSDIKKAVDMASHTPTACNRQMVKVYYVKDIDMKKKILKYPHGLTGFNVDNANFAIITYDESSLFDAGEFMQGYFNAGLFAMNFINALHSIGIGSCFLEYNNNYREEKAMKKILDIKYSEKIVVVIALGHYPESSVIPCSTRKSLDDLYEER
ncbi:nitroreductase family protein [Candidatus Saccharibacteria bacterium]|nr:nitroreductase family protein [Candidatus Saccharibacteria bacterium]